jgi:hypothetical protein
LNAASFVELRYFLQLRQIVPAVLVFYVYACFSALYPHGLRYLGLMLAIVALANIVGVQVELILCLLGAVALYCFYHWFKPDCESGASNPVFIVLSELPLQFGLFWLVIMFYGMATMVSWDVLQTGPYFNAAHDTAASLRSFRPAKELLLAGMQGMAPEEARFYQQQVQLGEIYQVPHPPPGAYPQRNQRPSLDEKLGLAEPETSNAWQFLHGEMLFKGVDRGTGNVVGWLGPDGFAPDLVSMPRRFTSVPWVMENSFILDARTIRQIDWENRRIKQKFSLDQLPDAAPEEFFKDSLGIFENFTALLSGTHLYLFRSGQLREFDESLSVETRLALPMSGNLQSTQIEVMELIDGYLVGVLVGANIEEMESRFTTYDRTGLFLYRTGADGDNVLLNSRALPSGFAASQIYEGFVLAPAFRLVYELVAESVIDIPSEAPQPFWRHHFPVPVLVLGLLSTLASGLSVTMLLRPLNLPAKAKITWVVVAAFSGVIGLACFYFGIYRGSLMMQRKLDEGSANFRAVAVAGHA